MTVRHLFDVAARRRIIGIFRTAGALFCLIALCAVFAPSAVLADDNDVDGIVLRDGKPVGGADVTLTGPGSPLKTTTRDDGKFHFEAVATGKYRVVATKDGLRAKKQIDAAGEGVRDITLMLTKDGNSSLTEIGRVNAPSASSTVLGTGNVLTFTGAQLARNSAAQDFSKFLAQLPAAVAGVNGRVYVNGSSSGVSYTINCVPIPVGLSRELASSIDADNVQYANVTEGAFPAEFGGKFGAAVTVSTKFETGPPAFGTQLTGGSLGTFANELFYRAALGSRGLLSLGTRAERTDWILDPPTVDAHHDEGSIANGLLRAEYGVGAFGTLDLVASQTHQTFQVPTPASSSADAYQDESDGFASLRYRFARSANSAFSVGTVLRHTRIRDDTGELTASSACGTQAPSCISFLSGSRTIDSLTYYAAYANKSATHDVRAGTSFTPSHALVAPLFTSAGVSATDTDSARSRSDVGAYLQDAWQLDRAWSLDYGLRADRLTASGDGDAYGQLSPRIKVSRAFGRRATVYAYFGRLFEPFDIDDYFVSPSDSRTVAFATPVALRPQRDSLYEVGGRLPIGTADVTIRVSHKDSTDPLDDGLIPNTNARQELNFQQGVVDLQSAYLVKKTARGGQSYLSLTHGRASLRGCVPGGVFTCAGISNGWVSADYDQRWTATAGQSIPLSRGWLTWNGQYGSGIQSSECVSCGGVAHLTFDVGAGRQLSRQASVSLILRNVFDDRYAVTALDELQGPHYSTPRSFEANFTIGE